MDFQEKHYSSCAEVDNSQKVLQDIVCSVKTLDNEGIKYTCTFGRLFLLDFTMVYERKNVHLRRYLLSNSDKEEKFTQTQILPQILKQMTNSEYAHNGINHKNNTCETATSLSCQVSWVFS